MKSLIAKKIGMTSTINQDGVVVAITLLQIDKNIITQIKSIETDGYCALQVGTKDNKRAMNKPQLGQQKKSKSFMNIIKEFRVDTLPEDIKVGDTLSADLFSRGDIVDAVATSKGKGWAGTIKRHNFHRQRKTHGGKGNTRQPGSIGSMYPQRIFKGKKMAGRMGSDRVTVKNLKVEFVDIEKSLIGLSGSVPGPRKGTVVLRGVNK